MIPQRIRGFLRKLLRTSLKLSVVLFFMLIVMEIAYRNQWIDTYKSALHGLNDAATLDKPGRTILILGDSFSASNDGWVGKLREKMPEYRIINASVAGTGIVQASIIAPGRFKAFQPDILIYQIYAGNDLIDYRYPIAWTRLNPFRNIYWWFAHRFRSLAWLNQAAGQIQSGPTPEEYSRSFDAPFSPELYTAREKLLLHADPGLLEAQAFLLDGKEADMKGYLRRLDEIMALCEAQGTTAYLMVLPHCAQVSAEYQQNMQALGADFSPAWKRDANYPFATRIAGHAGARAMVLNPLPDMQAAERAGRKLFYNDDPHLNAEGQQFLGDWIWNALRQPMSPVDGPS